MRSEDSQRPNDQRSFLCLQAESIDICLCL